ncbi:thioredoxin family protein [Bacillus sp. JJ722]|uniref:thioredoxin family protein n=1 Tax=Bacillus sp. JJ722 TaxID=3122973 RepID=UPI002FFDA9CE
MKKIIIFLAIIIALFAGIAFMNSVQNKEKTADNPYGKEDLEPLTIDLLDDENYQNIITPKNLEKKLENEKQTFVYFFQPDCSFCKIATPKLMATAKEQGLDINQYNLMEFEEGWDQYDIEGTPTLVVYEDGKEVDRKVGDDSEKGFKEFLHTHEK